VRRSAGTLCACVLVGRSRRVNPRRRAPVEALYAVLKRRAGAACSPRRRHCRHRQRVWQPISSWRPGGRVPGSAASARRRSPTPAAAATTPRSPPSPAPARYRPAADTPRATASTAAAIAPSTAPSTPSPRSECATAPLPRPTSAAAPPKANHPRDQTLPQAMRSLGTPVARPRARKVFGWAWSRSRRPISHRWIGL